MTYSILRLWPRWFDVAPARDRPTVSAVPSQLLTRREAAALVKTLIRSGSVAWLAKLARNGGGPRFLVSGRRPLYDQQDIIAWCAERLRDPQDARGTEPAYQPPLEATPIEPELRQPHRPAEPVAEALELLRNLGISA